MPFIVHIDSNRTWGGGQEQSLGLALALAARGEPTHFIAQKGSALAHRLPSTGLDWQALGLRGIAGLHAGFRLRRWFRRLRPDVVHVHDSAALLPVLLGAGCVGKGRLESGKPPRVVVTRRTAFPVKGRFRAGSYDRFCDRVICVSRAVQQRMREADVHADRLTIIPDFVDCRRFDPAAVVVQPGPPTILSVGRLSPEKGHDVLLRAMARVAQAAPRARLVICGEGDRRGALEKLAAAKGIAERVTFTGFVQDVRPLLAGADVFVMPSLSEGLGVAGLEAMAMARPVVASKTGGLTESVVHEETGLLVPPGEPEALAEAMLALLREPDRARAMGEAGRKRALGHFDRDRVVDQICALYAQVLTGF